VQHIESQNQIETARRESLFEWVVLEVQYGKSSKTAVLETGASTPQKNL
jgi:hypothetical protein